MQVEPRMIVQPLADVLVFVGGVVVQDQVDRQVFGHLAVDGLEELQPLLMPVARHALPDHRAGQHVQSSEQGGGAVPLVVVGHRLAPPLDHRQRRLRAVQCLHRGLLVRAQHDRLLRRGHVQPDDIDQFLLETRVVGQLERRHPMRFEPPRMPYQLHRRLRHPCRSSHRPTAPMGFTLRAVVLCQIDDLVDRGLRDRRFAATALADLTHLRQTLLGEPGTPTLHRRRRPRQRFTDAGDTDNDAAIAVLATPSAAISSALARTTSRCAPDCDRASDSSTSRCPADISNAGTGCLMAKSYRTYSHFIAGHTTRESWPASPKTAATIRRSLATSDTPMVLPSETPQNPIEAVALTSSQSRRAARVACHSGTAWAANRRLLPAMRGPTSPPSAIKAFRLAENRSSSAVRGRSPCPGASMAATEKPHSVT